MKLQISGLEGIKEVNPGDDIASLIVDAANNTETQAPEIQNGDVLVVTQKIVSKAEGCLREIDEEDMEARLALLESESVRILRKRENLIIAETRHGFVCANAGIDFSNVEKGYAALLPKDPDKSAEKIRGGINAALDISVAVVISDTFGRPWRKGLCDMAIGCAGLKPLLDLQGSKDAQGRELNVTQMAVADELASAAEMVMGKSSQIPVAIIKGVPDDWFGEGSIKEDLLRPASEDLFR